jgi:hypothetical protein
MLYIYVFAFPSKNRGISFAFEPFPFDVSKLYDIAIIKLNKDAIVLEDFVLSARWKRSGKLYRAHRSFE